MKVLVIGGTGIIGMCISEAAYYAGHEVWIISRDKKPIHNNNIQFHKIVCDWYDLKSAGAIMQQEFDVIVDNLVFDRCQLIRDLDIVQGHCKHFIFISSDSVYNRPMKNVKEDIYIDITKLDWGYSYHKREAELYLESHYSDYEFMISTVRPTITYGDTRIPCGFVGRRNQWTMLERILQNKPIVFFEDDNSLHAICHTSLFSAMVINMFMNEKTDRQIYHFAHDKSYTFDEIINIVGNILGKKPLILHYPVKAIKNYNIALYCEEIYDKLPTLTVNNDKSKTIRGKINCSIDLQDTLTSTINYLRINYSKKEPDRFYNSLCDLLVLNYRKYNLRKGEEKIARDFVSSLTIVNKMRLRIFGIEQILRNKLRPVYARIRLIFSKVKIA